MKLDDIPFVIHDINKEMPLESELNLLIPNFGFKPMPKSMLDTKTQFMKKYLDNHLHVIEEINHKFPNHKLPYWMRDYARKYYLNADILGHDGFFKCNEFGDFGNIKYYGGMTTQNVGLLGGLLQKANIATTETVTSTDDHNIWSSGQLGANKLNSTVVANSYFDRISIYYFSTTHPTNIRIGVYGDSSGPSALIFDSGSIGGGSGSGYYDYSLTESSIGSNTVLYLAHNQDSNADISELSSVTQKYSRAIAFGALPNPMGFTSGPTAFTDRMKIWHS